LLKANYPCIHLSAGQLLREEAAKKDESEHASLIEQCLVAGTIVPVEISLALLRNAMKDTEGQSLIFLIDGFPRNFDNLEGWARVMSGDIDAAAVWGVVMYDCPLSVLEKRVMERSKESGRSDDNLESLRRRFKTFQAETVPVVDSLRLMQKDTLLKVVDIAANQSLEKVWEETQKTINTFIANDILSANVRLLEAAAKGDLDSYRTLCADEMFQDVFENDKSQSSLSPDEIMALYEGTKESDFLPSNIKCAEMTFVTGTKVSLSYDRTLSSADSFRETRIWSHQGSKGWRMVHFFRTAQSS
jgi:UMP-CMP kinase